MEFHDMEANKGNLWTPTVGDGAPAELKVPNLVAIPNMLVNLLRNQGLAVTPYDVLASIDDFIKWRTGGPLGVRQEVVPGGRPSQCQRKKQGVS